MKKCEICGEPIVRKLDLFSGAKIGNYTCKTCNTIYHPKDHFLLVFLYLAAQISSIVLAYYLLRFFFIKVIVAVWCGTTVAFFLHKVAHSYNFLVKYEITTTDGPEKKLIDQTRKWDY
jgi:hypothetical protein